MYNCERNHDTIEMSGCVSLYLVHKGVIPLNGEFEKGTPSTKIR